MEKNHYLIELAEKLVRAAQQAQQSNSNNRPILPWSQAHVMFPWEDIL